MNNNNGFIGHCNVARDSLWDYGAVVPNGAERENG